MFGRKTLLRKIKDLRAAVIRNRVDLLLAEDRIAHLERLMEVGATRLDIHAQRLGTLEDDVEDLK